MTLNLRNPTGYNGQPGTQYKQGIVRFATPTEALAGTATNVAVTPSDSQAIIALNFASPPVLGFGSTTPRPVHATTLSALGAVTLNTSGAATTTIGTGGTGAVLIGNSTGNTAVTGDLSTTGNIDGGAAISSITSITAGSTLIATTSITSLGGDITANVGNVVFNSAGKQLRVHGGAVTDFIGTATLTSGTTGAIANTNIAATDRIFVQRVAANASTTLGELSYTISAGASFTITSLILGTPGSTQTADVSTVTYFIVRQL